MSTAPPPDHAEGATTLVEALHDLAENGYPTEMTTRPGGRVRCGGCSEEHHGSEFEVVETRRLEGASDVSDMALVAGLQCPSCEARGSVVVRYGPEMDDNDVDLLEALDVEAHDWTPDA